MLIIEDKEVYITSVATIKTSSLEEPTFINRYYENLAIAMSQQSCYFIRISHTIPENIFLF